MSNAEYFQAYYKANKERIKAASAKRRAEKPDECRAAVDRWHKDPENAERKRAYAREVAPKTDAFARSQQKYRDKNKDKAAKRGANWRAANPAMNCAKEARRRAAKMMRTPAWVSSDDTNIVLCLYELAAIYTQALGKPFHVDHEIPLQGRLVSGLHVPANLQVIAGAENIRKSNRFTIKG